MRTKCLHAKRGDAGYRQLPQKNQTCSFDAASPMLLSSVWSAAFWMRRWWWTNPYICVASSPRTKCCSNSSASTNWMIISDCPIDSAAGLFSVKIGECSVSFWCTDPLPEKRSLPAGRRRLLVPGRRSMLGRKLLNGFNSQGFAGSDLGG